MRYALSLLFFFATGCAADTPAPEPTPEPPLDGAYGPGGDGEVDPPVDEEELLPPSAPGYDDPETGLVDIEDDAEGL